MKVLLNGLSIVYLISGVAQYTLQLARGLEGLLGLGSVFCFGKSLLNEILEPSLDERSLFTDQVQYILKNEVRKVPCDVNSRKRAWRDPGFFHGINVPKKH